MLQVAVPGPGPPGTEPVQQERNAAAEIGLAVLEEAEVGLTSGGHEPGVLRQDRQGRPAAEGRAVTVEAYAGLAQFDLAVMYTNGTGVPQDYTEAVRLYRLAAAQGHAGAQCNLAVMYDNGTGVPQDYTEAVRLYRLAASQGEAGAQCNLAMMYENGTGLPQDHAEAARLYRRAADQGDATAQSNLGAMYQNGTGVLQDYTEAARLCRRAADKGAATAQYNLAVMYLKGTGVSQDHTKAARLLKLADDQGFRLARDALGHLTAEYPIGTRVQITGLTTAAPLNSRLGTVVRLTKPLIAAGRIAVRIDGQPKSVSLSLANVQRV